MDKHLENCLIWKQVKKSWLLCLLVLCSQVKLMFVVLFWEYPHEKYAWPQRESNQQAGPPTRGGRERELASGPQPTRDLQFEKWPNTASSKYGRM